MLVLQGIDVSDFIWLSIFPMDSFSNLFILFVDELIHFSWKIPAVYTSCDK
jgi:hypothetical protein